MQTVNALNEFVIKLANVNGSGSASANHILVSSICAMQVPATAKNIFPSNIQGLATWYVVRVSERGYLASTNRVHFMVCMNPQSIGRDIAEVCAGGYVLYDSSRPLSPDLMRSDVHYIAIPLIEICNREYDDPRQRQLFKNVMYVGALVSLLKIEYEVACAMIHRQFQGKKKLIEPNIHALQLGYDYAQAHYPSPIGLAVARRNLIGERIVIDGNSALALGALYGGATVATWYPITPSTSVVEAFKRYASQHRVDKDTGRCNYAVLQAEDEIAAIGMVIGAGWNGARAFTATSGPGISLMNEFFGLAYFAEVPAVIFDVQRVGPSTGLPTRTQQSDILLTAYASHGDTKHVLLFPSTPNECFEFAALAFDLADKLQTPIFVMSDLDLGMNEILSEPLQWDDSRHYDRGKVMDADQLEALNEEYGRYLDVDGDGICYRTLPGTHPTKGSFFTRGSAHNRYAAYSESGEHYADNMDRLQVKWRTAHQFMPMAELLIGDGNADIGVIFFGSSRYAALEALDQTAQMNITADLLQIKAFPFGDEIISFIESHQQVFIIEQNRDAQLCTLLLKEYDIPSRKLLSILHYDGTPITADHIIHQFTSQLQNEVSPDLLMRRQAG